MLAFVHSKTDSLILSLFPLSIPTIFKFHIGTIIFSLNYEAVEALDNLRLKQNVKSKNFFSSNPSSMILSWMIVCVYSYSWFRFFVFMSFKLSGGVGNWLGSSGEEHDKATRSSKMLDGSSDFVLTYEDKDGDWMLVGDVPWGYV